ncbi:prenyltransferase/squalene oxidase repeat-containing protein [Thermococcus prieurii]
MNMKRVLTMMLLIVLLTIPYSAAGSVLDNASRVFIGVNSYADTVPLKAYSLLALDSMAGKVHNETPLFVSIENITKSLLSMQNPDGGWGYHANEISTPQDTALALIALNYSLTVSREFGVGLDENALLKALREGESYLLDSYSSPGWGYVSGSVPKFYPTALSLWALGTLGLKYSNSLIVKTAADFIANASDLSPEYMALRLIAFHAVGYPNVTPYLSKCRELLSSDTLNEYQRAILTYAVILYDPLSFDVGRSLAILESLGMRNDTYLLVTEGVPFMTRNDLMATAYAVMAFSSVSDVLVNASPRNPRGFLYNDLVSRQNPDGGWPLLKSGISSAKATYYALLGISASGNPSGAVVKKAVAWARNHLPSAEEAARVRGTVTDDYYYTAMILIKFGNLSSAEKDELINFTRSLESAPGLWRGLFGIPQPYQTALGLNLLLALGYRGEDVDLAANWLLSISPSGWGVRLNYFMPATTGMDVPTTVTVLEALSKVVSPEKLTPHVKWLIEQRLPSGVWGYFGKSVTMLGRVSYATPSMEYTVRVVEVLRKLGYDYSRDVLPWVLKHALDSNMSTVDEGLALQFLSGFNLLPPTTLYEVIESLESGGQWYLNYWEGYDFIAQEIASSLLPETVITLVKGNLMPSAGNHIIIAPIGLVNVSRYNPFVSVYVNGTSVVVNGREYPLSTSIVLVPGRTQDGGYVLVILVGKDAVDGVPVLFTSGLYRYLHGAYMVLSAVDKNNDGKIEPEEITLLGLG